MNDHITKPVDPVQLFTALVKWLPGCGIKTRIEEEELPLQKAQIIVDKEEWLYDQLIAVSGLDMAIGLSLVRGRMGKYRRILQLFIDGHRNDAHHIADLIEQNDLTGAERLAHSLKGAAGSIGATEIFVLAGELDQRLKQGDGASAHVALFPLIDSLSGFIKAVQAILDEDC